MQDAHVINIYSVKGGYPKLAIPVYYMFLYFMLLHN
jgi:hypothetical protein